MESRRDGAHRSRAGRRLLPPPVWRYAPRRLLHDSLTLALVVGVLTMVSVAAAAGPLYAETVSDAAARLVLDAVPEGASANAAPVVRLTGGVDPAPTDWSDALKALGHVPDLDPPTVTVQSITTELHPRYAYDPVGPVLTGAGGSSAVRLFGIEDAAAHLVVVSRAPGASEGIWLPAPVAEASGTSAGDDVTIRVSGLPDMPTVTTTVLGTYAVEADGRTPRDPAGEQLWADVVEAGFPSDAETPARRAHLAVADVDTVAALGGGARDALLWAAQSRLAARHPRLADLRRAAAGVVTLRGELAAGAALADEPVALRPGVASGVEDLASSSGELATAARRGAAVTTRAGIVLALALAVAAAAYATGRRRREVRLAAGVGRRPVSAGLLYGAELLPAAVVAAPLGWFVARGLVAVAVGPTAPTRSALTAAALWCAGSVLLAVVASGGVAAVATRLETRRLEGRPRARPPWVLVIVVVAASATAGLVGRDPSPAERLGPLDLLVPPLLCLALAAVGARVAFALVRRLRPAPRPPTRRSVTRWMARRRLRAPDPGREAAVSIAATGLAMLVFSLAALSSLQTTVEDRAALAVGATIVDRVGSSWLLDPGAAVQAPLPEDGSPLELEDVPVGRTPPLPGGQTVVWRTRTSVATSTAGVALLVLDPANFAAAAAWGSDGGPVAQGRGLLPALAAEDAEATRTIRSFGMAGQVPALLVGTLADLDLEVGSSLTVDTLNLPVRVVVRGVVPAFPGTTTGQPTLVLPADSFFSSQLNEDPRLRPAPRSPRNAPVEFQADLWSATTAEAAETLQAHDIAPQPVGTLAGVRTTAVYVAAEQARRYQIGLGLVFGAVGLTAVALGAVRLARRSPAADRMLAWSGAGRRTPVRARVTELGVVLALSAALAAGALLALRPLAGTLLEPGDGLDPEATLVVPASALLAGGGWLVLTALVAVLGTVLAASSQPAVEVLRGED